MRRRDTICGAHGEYELLDRIKRGGMAEVFRAVRHGVAGFERVVAIKRMLPELAAQDRYVQMFLDEAKIAAQLAHPNIVQTIDLGMSRGQYFIALEYINGVDLRTLLRRCRRVGAKIPRRHACRIVAEVCAGLSYAHNKRVAGRRLDIVHRDVSPPNVLVSAGGEVKLIDFGVVKAAERRSVTVAGTVKGKVPYLAPEQVMGAPVDHRCDIFAAGVLLWELLTTDGLFRGSSDKAIMYQIRECAPLPPSAKNPGVPRQLDDIVARALERDPAERYQSASEMQDRLCDYMRASGDNGSARGLATWVERVMAPEGGDPYDLPTRLVIKEDAPRTRLLTTVDGGPVTKSTPTEVGRVVGRIVPRVARGTAPELATTADRTVRRDQAQVRFESVPAGAQVYLIVDGAARKVGTTPVEASVDDAIEYRVSVRKSGYENWSGALPLVRRDGSTLRATLTPARRSAPIPARTVKRSELG